MKITLHYKYVLWFILLCALGVNVISCQKSKDITIDLPPYERQLVLECYLEIGKPVQLVLTESVSYFDTPELVPVYDALVTITYRNTTDTLKNITIYKKENGQGFNYLSTFVVPEDYDNIFYINIQAKDGRTASAQTRLQRPVPIQGLKSVVQGRNSDLTVFFEDNLGTHDYYRLLFFQDSVHRNPDADILVTDELYNSKDIGINLKDTYGTGSTCVVELYHMNKDYYEYVESVKNAIIANYDPLTRPTPVKSNVSGALGIFTSASYSRDTIHIP